MFNANRSRRPRAIKTATLVLAAMTALTVAACSGSDNNDSTSDGSSSEAGSVSSTDSSTDEAGSESTSVSSTDDPITDSEAGSGTLAVAVSTPPISLDPTTAGNGLPLAWYMTLAYEPLIQRDPDGNVAPGLATDWGYSEDRLSFTMTLREDAMFSDGDEVTADAVVAWLKHYKENGTFSGTWLPNVSEFAATGPLEVTLTLSAPDPTLEWGLGQAGNAGAVVSPTGLANLESLGTQTHGAGPYVLDEGATVANSSYVFQKNPNYYDPDVQYYQTIELTVIADQNSALSALQSGQVQVAQGSASNAEAAEQAGLTVTTGPSAWVGVYFADFDGTVVPEFADVRVRQALNYAIDRDAVTTAVYGDYGIPTAQYVPEQIDGYLAELEDRYPYDPDKARELLAEAGYPDGFSFTMLAQTGIDNGDLLAQVIVAQWAEVGVEVELDTFSAFADYVTAFFSNEFGATTVNFNYGDQLIGMTGLATNPAVYNTFGFTDEGVNALAADQKLLDADSPEGIAAAEESATYMVETAFAVPVSSIDAVLLSDDSVTNVGFGTFPPQPQYWKPAG